MLGARSVASAAQVVEQHRHAQSGPSAQCRVQCIHLRGSDVNQGECVLAYQLDGLGFVANVERGEQDLLLGLQYALLGTKVRSRC